MSERRKLIIGAVALVVITFILTAGLFVYAFGLTGADVQTIAQFGRVLNMIQTKYVEEVPVNTLVTGAIRGMLGALNDPHSVYMDAKMFREFQIETEGSFGGVGIVIGAKENKVITVIAPIEGTPGEKAGIRAGDQILKIDGRDTKDMTVDEAASLIRGPEGTQVTLTVRREGEKELREFTLTRAIVQVKTVSGKMLENGIGYIRITMFNENTGQEFARFFADLETQGMRGLILDLRDNPGGLLDECVKVAQKLVPKGPIVSVVGRDGRQEVHSSKLEQVKYPLVVLVNGGSASASEIVAGAVQDTKAGTLVGTKTYGKGSVQTIFRLDGQTAVKLTIAKYLTPGGRAINGKGIEPDITVVNPETGTDLQLEKAKQLIRDKIH